MPPSPSMIHGVPVPAGTAALQTARCANAGRGGEGCDARRKQSLAGRIPFDCPPLSQLDSLVVMPIHLRIQLAGWPPIPARITTPERTAEDADAAPRPRASMNSSGSGRRAKTFECSSMPRRAVMNRSTMSSFTGHRGLARRLWRESARAKWALVFGRLQDR